MLINRWVGSAREEVSSNKEMIVCSFKKCGISANLDHLEDTVVNTEGVSDYTPPEDNSANSGGKHYVQGPKDYTMHNNSATEDERDGADSDSTSRPYT